MTHVVATSRQAAAAAACIDGHTPIANEIRESQGAAAAPARGVALDRIYARQ